MDTPDFHSKFSEAIALRTDIINKIGSVKIHMNTLKSKNISVLGVEELKRISQGLSDVLGNLHRIVK